MKSSLHTFFLSVFACLALFQGNLNAGATCTYEHSAEESYCYPPDWYNTYGITETSATFQWEEVYNASYYTVQYRVSGGTWYSIGGYCYQTWINCYDLDPCSSYEWRVRAHCSYGNYSSWCYPNYFNTLCNVCPKPYSTSESNITEHSARLHWSEVWGAESYVVQIQWPGGSWMTIPGSPCQPNWLDVYGLEPGTSYDWRVKAKCGYNSYSDWTYGWFETPHYYNCYYPSNLHCYDIGDYYCTWSWGNVYGADYYHVQWRYPGGTWYDLGGGWCYNNWIYVNHLNPCTTYEWRVKSYCHYGGWSQWCYPHTFTTTCHSSCSVPGGLITKDIGDYKATFKWSSVYGASSYTLQMKDAWGNWYDIPGSPTTGTWITVYNLTPCKSYEWRIRANCHYNSHSYWSESKHFTTSCGNGCYAPQWAYTNGISGGSATLHWAPVPGADYYVVEWRPSGGTWTELQSGPVTNTFVELTGLQSSATYQWRVKSHCHTGVFSGWSSETYFSTLGLSCGLPMFRYTTPITDVGATFNWSAVPGALNYTVQIREINGIWVDVVGSPTIGTNITVSNLNPNTQYEWRMQVNCANGGYSPWLSAIKFTTGLNPGCGTPGGLFADNLSLSAATLNWSPVSGAEAYSVEIRTHPSGAWNTVIGSPVATNSITVDGLSPFTTYEFRVRTRCVGSVHSFWSPATQFTTTNAPPCNTPDGLASSAITETTATLSWGPVTGAQRYHLQTRLPNGTWIDLPGGGVTDTFALATGFTQNTTYEWRVSTQCDSLVYSNWSTARMFTTIGSGAANDNCDNAILLTVENSCVSTFASNVDATPSDPAPAGGCWSNGYKDVWFKFSMPDVVNPAVTIRTSAGSLGNAVMEVYSGNECGIQSVITCEDNNDNGNGSSMPVVNLTGTPNAIIWVRVWGFDGGTGTFTICVFNGISFNYAGAEEDIDPVDGEIIEEITELPSVLEESNATAELHVSPNPVSDELNVVVDQTSTTMVTGLRIMDLSGKMMLAQQVEATDVTQFKTGVDMSNLLPGIYVLQVQTTSGMMAEKISVIR